MAWNYKTALERITRLISQHPAIIVENVDQRLGLLRESRGPNLAAREALISIPRNTAVLVDGVHVYAQLSNYDDYRLDEGRETEGSHKRALAFLHLFYGAMDRIVQDFGAQRVDYHGARLHCVVVDPADNEVARVLKALVLAQALQGLVRLASQEISRFDFDPKLKIGVDTGKCVAINDGKGCEQEPLFLGNAANYAAKLADGVGEGIFLSNSVRSIVGMATLPGGLTDEKFSPLQHNQLLEFRTRASARGANLSESLTGGQDQIGRLITEWQSDIREHRSATGGPEAFQFHTHTPPLHSIDYNDLSPSNSIRMQVASIFADLDGYTAYIENRMASGRAEEAVRALHVIRGEFHNVLARDFESRKVRYVGDCIHGVLAFGTASEIDLARTTREAVKCAAGMQASFEIVQEQLGGLETLGLATGIEVGATPISRIGIRGDRSVRVASSTATIQSQVEQEGIKGSAIALGPVARSHLSLSAQRHFPEGKMTQPDYEDVSLIFAGAAMLSGAHSSSAHAAEEFRPHSQG